MKQYFKDYKSKMAKDEEQTKESIVNVQVKSENTSRGLFVKRRADKTEVKSESDQPKFMFNFSAEPAISADEKVKNVCDQVDAIKLQ